MSEDPLSADAGSELLAGLGDGDIDPNIYEGGLKSWECSLDLVGVLARDGERGQGVLEVCECFFLFFLLVFIAVGDAVLCLSGFFG